MEKPIALSSYRSNFGTGADFSACPAIGAEAENKDEPVNKQNTIHIVFFV
jgi:hypothetical protein